MLEDFFAQICLLPFKLDLIFVKQSTAHGGVIAHIGKMHVWFYSPKCSHYFLFEDDTDDIGITSNSGKCTSIAFEGPSHLTRKLLPPNEFQTQIFRIVCDETIFPQVSSYWRPYQILSLCLVLVRIQLGGCSYLAKRIRGILEKWAAVKIRD